MFSRSIQMHLELVHYGAGIAPFAFSPRRGQAVFPFSVLAPAVGFFEGSARSALFVCVLSVMKLVSLACKALRDVRESWLGREQSQLMRMVRSGRAGLNQGRY